MAGLIIPMLPVLIGGLKGGFTITISPGPILCAGANVDNTYWAIICPTSIMLGIGTSILICTLRTVIKV